MPSPAPRPEAFRYLRWLAYGHFANAILTGLAGVGIVLHPAFRQTERMTSLGAFLALACVLLAVLDWWAGLCLRNGRGRGFCRAVSALNCLCLPGVLVGLPTLAVLARPAVAKLFTESLEPLP